MAYTDNFTLYSVLLPFLVFVSYDDCFYLVYQTQQLKGASYPKIVLFVLCTLYAYFESTKYKKYNGSHPEPRKRNFDFAISFCKTFSGAPTSSASVAYILNKRLFYYETNLSK
jgi:hypothetical protein